MDSTQKRYLKDRLSKLRQQVYDLRLPEPAGEEAKLNAEIKRLQGRVQALFSKRRAPHDKMMKDLHAIIEEAKGPVLFAKPENALAVIGEVEARFAARLKRGAR